MQEHCFYCIGVLDAHLSNGTKAAPEPAFDNKSFPLFVTWTQARNGELRGCIGNFSAMPLHTGLREYALTSALRDGRFAPVQRKELSRLVCGVSLLTDFEDGDDWQDWEVGRHGIRIRFTDEQGRSRSATYLPEVAKEQGWSHREAIDSLLRKGGFRAAITAQVRESVSLERYQSAKEQATYDDYLHWTNSGSH
ncbi:AMMECR1 domain-containing protein [Entophlyctis helioformis]|nr:AMMECR1 domain-containing protein [Entophlyctis helioformis]